MVDLTIFSKDRPAQLELLLRSMKENTNIHEFYINILYLYTDREYCLGYDRAFSLHKDIHLNTICENDLSFEKLTKGLARESKTQYLMYFVDDIFFRNRFSLNCCEFETFNNRGDIACLSLRMCPRMDYCYTEKKTTPPPQFEQGNVWNWTNQIGDWGYPMSTDGHIFKRTDLLPIILRGQFKNPNTFESALASASLRHKPKMICFSDSIIVNNPINRVQTVNDNRAGDIDPKVVNKVFLEGGLINYSRIRTIQNLAPHAEMPIEWYSS